jgi:hypothetical protein
VKILAYLTETFIGTFGITRPRPEQEKLANLVIGGFLLVFMVGNEFAANSHLCYQRAARNETNCRFSHLTTQGSVQFLRKAAAQAADYSSCGRSRDILKVFGGRAPSAQRH